MTELLMLLYDILCLALSEQLCNAVWQHACVRVWQYARRSTSLSVNLAPYAACAQLANRSHQPTSAPACVLPEAHTSCTASFVQNLHARCGCLQCKAEHSAFRNDEQS